MRSLVFEPSAHPGATIFFPRRKFFGLCPALAGRANCFVPLNYGCPTVGLSWADVSQRIRARGR